MVTAAWRERQRLADELERVGPEAPTLCGGWTTRDLAAHLVVRDRRPDAAPGVVVAALSRYTEAVRSRAAGGDYATLVEHVRSGPPMWSPVKLDAVDRLVNTTEFFVHLEDVRRAQPDWEPRLLDDELNGDLHAALGRMAKLFARRTPAGITLVPDDGRAPIVARQLEPMVSVAGPVGELVLWMFGRQAHSCVEHSGPSGAIEAVRRASFGI